MKVESLDKTGKFGQKNSPKNVCMCVYVCALDSSLKFRKVDHEKKLFTLTMAQSAGAAEYTKYISAKSKTPPTNVLNITLNNLMVRLQ